jgi:uncharacterized protein YjbI with pentapeptide repeats
MKEATEPSGPAADEVSAKSGSITGWVLSVPLPVLIVVLVYVGVMSYITEWAGFADKKLWNYLDVFLVPVLLAVGATGFTLYESRRQQQAQAAQRQAEAAQQQRERMAEEARRKREDEALEAQKARALAVENERAQDEALQAYLDQIGHLLLEKNLRGSEDESEVRTLARARTLTVLPRLDSGRKLSVVQFLYKSGLIKGDRRLDKFLDKADLSGVNWENTDLIRVDLSGTDLRNAKLRKGLMLFADLSWAKLDSACLQDNNLSNANLSNAHLTGADLRGADLQGADLRFAHMENADLSGAKLGPGVPKPDLDPSDLNSLPSNLEARLVLGDLIGRTPGDSYVITELSYSHLKGVILRDADLSHANLFDADLSDADLAGANLEGATADVPGKPFKERLANETLERQAKSLVGATMPDRQKYEAWLKDKEGRTGEDRENSGPS